MAIIGVFSIAPALPRIVKELQISSAEIGWLISVFTLPGIFVMPLIGVCADIFGRTNVVGASLLVFALAGIGCFLVNDYQSLLIMRFFQGIGAAPLSSLNIAFISDLYDGNKRIKAMGYNQAVLSIGATVLTAIGGSLAMLGWRFPFLLPALGLPIAFLVLFRLKCPASPSKPNLSQYVNSLRKTHNKKQIFACYLLMILVLIVVWGAYISYFPILMDVKLGSSPAVIGFIMTAMTLASALASSQMGKLANAISGRSLFRASFVFYGLALLSIPFISKTWLFLLPVFIFGIAQGIVIPTLQGYLGRYSSAENRGIVMALYGSSIRIGQSLGPLLAGVVYPFIGIDGIFYFFAGIAILLIGAVGIIIK